MARAKDLVVKPIAAADANRVIKALHYSGKTVQNSQVHLGVFLDGKCGGAMQFGPSLDKRKIQGLIAGTLWNEFIELNRMAFADWLPRNGESRCIGYAMRWLRRTYPWLKWVVSFSDATQCGDGTIYRASGFELTGIKQNTSIWETPEGMTFTGIGVRTGANQQSKVMSTFSRTTATTGRNMLDSGASSMKKYKDAGCRPKAGFQLRYIYFLDPTARDRLTVPVLPFSAIDDAGAGMYRGQKRVRSSETGGDHPSAGGAAPTRTLHRNGDG